MGECNIYAINFLKVFLNPVNVDLVKFYQLNLFPKQDEKHWLVATIETKLFIWKYEIGKKSSFISHFVLYRGESNFVITFYRNWLKFVYRFARNRLKTARPIAQHGTVAACYSNVTRFRIAFKFQCNLLSIFLVSTSRFKRHTTLSLGRRI